MEMGREQLIEDFCDNASKASYHFTDDSGKEWNLAYKYQQNCRDIYRNADDELKELLRFTITENRFLIAL